MQPLLPISETEMKVLYQRACASGGMYRVPRSASPNAPRRLTIPGSFDIILYLGLALSLGWFTPVGMVTLFGSGVVVAAIGWFHFTKGTPVGPFGALFARRQAVVPDVDPFAPEVVGRVVDYLVSEPLTQGRELRRRISVSLGRVEHSLGELPRLMADLQDEIASAPDPQLAILLQARLDRATQVYRRLQGLHADLYQQAQEVEASVQPIQDLYERFQRYQRLNQSLSLIQSAHELAEDETLNLAQRRAELSLLNARSSAAIARLEDLQALVKANVDAIDEVNALSQSSR